MTCPVPMWHLASCRMRRQHTPDLSRTRARPARAPTGMRLTYTAPLKQAELATDKQQSYFGDQNSTSLTGMLKVKRGRVDEHFADLIDEMYAE